MASIGVQLSLEQHKLMRISRIKRIEEKEDRGWSYEDGIPDRILRFISVGDLISPNATITLSQSFVDLKDAGSELRYAAISHAWDLSPAAEQLSRAANRPLVVELKKYTQFRAGMRTDDMYHLISWHGLVQAAKAAERLGCNYIWLDLLCINQTSDNDKQFQIKNMGNIYGKAKAVIVMPGGVAAAQKLEDEAPWITRAWTLQEAVLCRNTWVLFQRNTPVVGDFGDRKYFDEDLGLYALKSLLPFTDTTVKCFGNGAAVKSLQAILEAKNDEMRISAAWRCIWLRTSKREQDMVFSVMHLFGVHDIKVDYSKSRDYLIHELVLKTSKTPSFLDIGSLPFWDEYGLLPKLPFFTKHGKPLIKVGGRDQDAYKFIYCSTYISKFDLKMLLSSYPFYNGDMICARVFRIQYGNGDRLSDPYISYKSSTHKLPRSEVNGTHAVVIGEETLCSYQPGIGDKSLGHVVFFMEKSESGQWIKLPGKAPIPRYFLGKERNHFKVGGSTREDIMPCVCNDPLAQAGPAGALGNRGPLPPAIMGANVSTPFGKWFR